MTHEPQQYQELARTLVSQATNPHGRVVVKELARLTGVTHKTIMRYVIKHQGDHLAATIDLLNKPLRSRKGKSKRKQGMIKPGFYIFHMRKTESRDTNY